MVDINQVVDIKSAQELDYDNRKLNSAEKKILEDENLKEADGVTVNISKLKKAVELLEIIIKAKKETSFNDILYTKLNDARSEKEVVKALNQNLYYQSAIDHLISKRGKPSDGSDKSEDDINRLIDDRNTKISILEIRIKRLREMEERIASDQGNLVEKIEKEKIELETLEDLSLLMRQDATGPVAGRPLHGVNLNNYTDIDGTTKTGHANELLEGIVTRSLNSVNHKKYYYETQIPDYYGGHWISKDQLETLGLQFWEIFLDIGKSVFFAKATHLGSNKSKLESYWDDLSKFEWSWATENGFYARWYNKRDGSLISKEISKRDNKIWPEKEFDFEKLREFIELCFGGDIKKLPSDFVKLLEKEVTFKWLGYSNEPFKNWTKKYEIKKWLEENFPDKLGEKELNVRKVKGGLPIARLIKDAFTELSSGTIISKTNWSAHKDSFERMRENIRAQVLYVKSIRSHPEINQKLISDKELLAITQLSKDIIFRERKKQKMQNSLVGRTVNRDSKKARFLPTNELIDVPEEVKINTSKPTTSAEYRIDTTPLNIKISRKKAGLQILEGKKNISSSGGAKIHEDALNLELQKSELEQEIIEFEAEKEKLKKQDPTTIKAEFKTLFGDDLNANILRKFTRAQTILLTMKLNAIKAKESPMEKWFVDAEKKLKEEILQKLEPHDAKILQWEKSANTTNERLDNCPDNIELEKFREAYEESGKIVKLLESEKTEQEALRRRIAGESSPIIPPKTSDLTTESLGTLFGFTVDATLLETWKKVGTKTLNEAELNRLFLNDYAPTKTKHGTLLGHLSEKGDSANDKVYDISTDAKKLASWEKLLKKGPETTIKTIVIHDNDDVLKDDPDQAKKDAIITRMKGAGTHYDEDKAKNKFDKEKYGNPEEPATIDKDKLISFLYDEKIGNISQRSTVWEEAPVTDSDNENKGKVEESWKDWFVPRKDNILKPCVTYIGGFLVIAGIAAFIFWKNISDWWNGPAEEQNKGEVEEGGEKDEEE